jgi:hypothetical protein
MTSKVSKTFEVWLLFSGKASFGLLFSGKASFGLLFSGKASFELLWIPLFWQSKL